MQTMEEMVKTYYKEPDKSKEFRLAAKIEKKIRKLASKGVTYYEACFTFVRIETLDKVAQIFTKLGYSAWINKWEYIALCLSWRKPEEIK